MNFKLKVAAMFGVFCVLIYLLHLTSPIVIIDDTNHVISVDGKDTYRKLTPFDYRECRIFKDGKEL